MKKTEESEHELLLEEAFWNQFEQDIQLVQARLIIQSGFIANRRVRQLEVLLKPLIQRNVQVCIFLQKPEFWDVPRDRLPVDIATKLDAISNELMTLKQLGAHVTLIAKVHMKFVILDEAVFYEGSLNVLSHNNTLEGMRRFNSVSETRKKVRQERFLFCQSCKLLTSNLNFDNVSKQFQAARRNLGMTQSEIAKYSRKNQCQITKIETGGDVLISTLSEVTKSMGLSILLLPNSVAPAVANLLSQLKDHALHHALDKKNLTPQHQTLATSTYDFSPGQQNTMVRESHLPISFGEPDEQHLPSD